MPADHRAFGAILGSRDSRAVRLVLLPLLCDNRRYRRQRRARLRFDRLRQNRATCPPPSRPWAAGAGLSKSSRDLRRRPRSAGSAVAQVQFSGSLFGNRCCFQFAKVTVAYCCFGRDVSASLIESPASGHLGAKTSVGLLGINRAKINVCFAGIDRAKSSEASSASAGSSSWGSESRSNSNAVRGPHSGARRQRLVKFQGAFSGASARSSGFESD